MLIGNSLTQEFLSRILSARGIEFVLEKIKEQKELGIIEQAANIHSICTNISKEIIEEHYFNFWANWKPGNKSDLFVFVDQEVKDYCYKNLKIGERHHGTGLYLYLAAKNNFRCTYTGIPLLPLKPGILNNEIKLPEDIAQKYAWYPSIDHIDSITQDDKTRHSIKNLVLAGSQVNWMFGSISKDTAKKVMYNISIGKLFDEDISILFGKESLIKSSRVK